MTASDTVIGYVQRTTEIPAQGDANILHYFLLSHDKWVPVTTAWRVLRLWMEERPPVMEGSCEYFE
jgi:hypothetical protein